MFLSTKRQWKHHHHIGTNFRTLHIITNIRNGRIFTTLASLVILGSNWVAVGERFASWALVDLSLWALLCFITYGVLSCSRAFSHNHQHHYLVHETNAHLLLCKSPWRASYKDCTLISKSQPLEYVQVFSLDFKGDKENSACFILV